MKIRLDTDSGNATFDKVVFTAFVDCPLPNKITVYLELVARNQAEFRIETSTPSAPATTPSGGASNSCWLRAHDREKSFYIDTEAMRVYLRRFREVSKDCHHDDTGDDKYLVWHADTNANEVTSRSLKSAARASLRPNASVQMSPELEGVEDGRRSTLGGWFSFVCDSEFRVSGRASGQVRFAIETGKVEIHNLYIWVVLPKDYRGSGGHYDTSAPSMAPGHVVFLDNPATYKCVKEWESLIRERHIGHSRNAIRLDRDGMATLDFSTNSESWQWRAGRDSFVGGVFVALAVSTLSSSLLKFIDEKQAADSLAVFEVSIAFFIVSLAIGVYLLWRERR